jgi:hypothetical protein
MKPLEIAVRLGGKVHSGAYTVEDMGAFTLEDVMVRVTYQGKSKTTQVRGSSPETIAGMLLRELVWESRHH